MSTPRIFVRFAALATAVVCFALAPAAQARVTHHATRATVTTHVHRAQSALRHLRKAVRAHDSARARVALVSARRQAAVAAAAARSLATVATPTTSLDATSGLVTAAGEYDQIITTISSLVDEVSGAVQNALAQAIPASLAGRQSLLDALNGLLGMVPAGLQPQLAGALTGLTSLDTSSLGALTGVLGGGGLPAPVADIVTQALGLASSVLSQALDLVHSLIGVLPAAAQDPVNQALDAIKTQVSAILDQVEGLLGSSTTAGGGSGPLAGVQSLISGLLGSLFPHASTTSTTGLASLPGLGLLGGLFGGGSSTGALPGLGLLSGLLGGIAL